MGYLNRGNGPGLVACTVIPFALTWIFASIRIYIRRFVLKLWKLEDWLFLASQICFSFLALCAFLATFHGDGQHLRSVASRDLPTVMKYWYTFELIYIITSLLIRLSIGYFLLRICYLRAQLLIIRLTMIIMTLGSILYFSFMVFQCRPVAFFWLRFSGGQGRCFSGRTMADVTIVYSVLSAVVDLLFGILPMFVVARLMMDVRAKCVMGVLLTLGILAGLSVIVRIFYVNDLVDPQGDFTYLTLKVAIWSIIEPAIGIICMAITAYRPLFKSLHERISSDERSGARSPGINGPMNIRNSYTSSNPKTNTMTRNHSTTTRPLTSPSPTYSPSLLRNLSRKNSRKGMLTRTRSTASNDSRSFEDLLEKEGMQRQLSVTGGRNRSSRNKDWEDGSMTKDGIMRSMTLTMEVHRLDEKEEDMTLRSLSD
ncbi:uncharacterized protein RSE6_13380 [Rhynchosporium secalis]|uniref:Rhodopsin domain-containing protein n=1 Tax=Rhynchosporium secalis TaxID=38038 RepID=A0A1E1MTK2_RHYSE|nr:uncharacterized protein RSE6_13380 [Rhynchosporium secalis]